MAQLLVPFGRGNLILKGCFCSIPGTISLNFGYMQDLKKILERNELTEVRTAKKMGLAFIAIHGIL